MRMEAVGSNATTGQGMPRIAGVHANTDEKEEASSENKEGDSPYLFFLRHLL